MGAPPSTGFYEPWQTCRSPPGWVGLGQKAPKILLFYKGSEWVRGLQPQARNTDCPWVGRQAGPGLEPPAPTAPGQPCGQGCELGTPGIPALSKNIETNGTCPVPRKVKFLVGPAVDTAITLQGGEATFLLKHLDTWMAGIGKG